MNQKRPRMPRDPQRGQSDDETPQSPFGSGLGRGRPWSIFVWILIGLALTAWLWMQFSGAGSAVQINYTTFLQQVRGGNVTEVTISGEEIRGTLRESRQTTVDGQTQQYTEFVTYVPSFGDENLLSLLEEQNVEIETTPEQDFSWTAILINFLPLLLLIGLGVMFFSRMRQQGQNVLSIGKSQAKQYDRSSERTTFDDVAGNEGAKRELEEIIDFLRTPERFERLGGETPKGVLLVGPPGTGKTLMARAVAGEADVPFFSITGSDFMEMFVGVGASRVRDLFEEAKKVAPAIIFIDELDSIGRRRGAGLGGAHDEREQTLNQLLSELDGFEPNENVIVMAATNRPDILDPALLRPGRFDRRIAVDLPTTTDRHKILEIHAKNKPLADDVDLEQIARGTPGFSGADLENLLNEAALLAGREDKDVIEEEDVEGARDKVLMGLEREGLMLTEEEQRMLAYHEGGHAVIAAVLPHADPIHKVTIVPRGQAMGVTQQLPEREKYIYPRDYLLDRVAVMMGGRAAEELVMGTRTSGAANDFQQATQLVRKMVLSWGMSDRFEHISLGGGEQNVFLGRQIAEQREYSESTAYEIDQEIERILDAAYERAINTLREYRDGLDRLAEALLEEEELPGERVLELVGVDKEQAQPEPIAAT